ncbi:phage portal protein [Agrobacterium tumefaciens]|uniref:phage portal protein n=1 Tax=Agrobacterium tumefaciens TaxID=358 RepID=UPI0015719D41|nr:phage portal protein [Agrobacterium tumefaciens]NSZ00871.1 phage portal protein [Agrobacterium tumefaciens]NSZ36892.1 phage portal protein [Agrobacterium tumefaciens]NTB26005.1 phage portal protein [Agrobacterium tumefaciens]NTB30157.1 phage portal protein [Agrobacterium tumefaciens]NTB36419.1 phage portal protein [Agrobacterium tumefaciens]
MGFWSEVKNRIGIGERKAHLLSDPAVSEIFGVRSTASGVSVGGLSALNTPAVLQAVRLISETIGSLPVKLHREQAEAKEIASKHTAHKIVHKRANEWTGAGAIRTQLTSDALIYGNGFARVVRYPDGRPFELIRLLPGTVSVMEDALGAAPPFYRVSENGGSRQYSHTEILHIPSFLGRSPISFGREAIGLTSVLEKHGATFFTSGARPNAIISNEKAQGGEAGATIISNMRKSFREWMRGASADPLILDGGWKYEAPALTSTDSQYVENRLEQINEIARIFGVPPHLLFQLERATWSNAEQMGASFLQLCLRPWLDKWQEALATVLLTEIEQNDHWFEFVVDDLMRADMASRTANITALVTNRVMSPNEARAILNMPPLPGGDELINPHTTSGATPFAAPEKEPAK